MTDLSSTSGSSELTSSTQPMAAALDLAHHLGQVSLDSSPVLTAKTPKYSRKFSLRELEIQQTIGESFQSFYIKHLYTTSLNNNFWLLCS